MSNWAFVLCVLFLSYPSSASSLVFLMYPEALSLRYRHRKDELERRMSALQESRRELMVQLEGLMRLLKVRSPVPGTFIF